MEQPEVRHQVREVTQGLSRGQGGYELVLTPLVLALGGLWADGRLGITPVLTVIGAVVGFFTVFVCMFYGYRHDMERLADHRPARRPLPVEPIDSAPPKWIERELGDIEVALPPALRREAVGS